MERQYDYFCPLDCSLHPLLAAFVRCFGSCTSETLETVASSHCQALIGSECSLRRSKCTKDKGIILLFHFIYIP